MLCHFTCCCPAPIARFSLKHGFSGLGSTERSAASFFIFQRRTSTFCTAGLTAKIGSSSPRRRYEERWIAVRIGRPFLQFSPPENEQVVPKCLARIDL